MPHAVRHERNHVKGHPPPRQIPWRTIGVVLAGAAIVAWAVGFVAGLIVRFVAGA